MSTWWYPRNGIIPVSRSACSSSFLGWAALTLEPDAELHGRHCAVACSTSKAERDLKRCEACLLVRYCVRLSSLHDSCSWFTSLFLEQRVPESRLAGARAYMHTESANSWPHIRSHRRRPRPASEVSRRPAPWPRSADFETLVWYSSPNFRTCTPIRTWCYARWARRS